MIKNLQDLIQALNKAYVEDPRESRFNTPVRAYLNGRYVIEDVRLSKDDGTIVMWLDERGDQEER